MGNIAPWAAAAAFIYVVINNDKSSALSSLWGAVGGLGNFIANHPKKLGFLYGLRLCLLPDKPKEEEKKK